MTESPLMDSGFAVHVFSPGDDLIACLNKAMDFLTVVVSLRVTVQQVQGRQGQSYSGTGYKSNATSSRGNNASGQARVVKCYNYQGEGHMARQCTQPKRPRNATWYKDKAMLAEAQEAGQILDEEQLAFLADSVTENLDTYDFDYDDVSNAKAVLMANISNYGSNVISEVPHFETYLNDMENQSVHAMQDFDQTPVVDFTDNEITSNSNIIPYSQYLQETQQTTVQDTNLLAQQDSMIFNLELERYKEQVKTFEQRLNIDLSSREKMIDSQMDDMIKEKLVLKEQVDSLEQNLSKQIKKESQRIKPTLYDGIVIYAKHVAMRVIDDEETLILEEESRSKIGSSCELPKVSLVNASLKKLKFHLAQFDSVVKKRTTPYARTEGEWGFEHTKAVFNNEIIPFIKSLKDIFNVFDKEFLNEIIEVQTVFNQMEPVVQQSSVDKQCLEIAKKELLLENDRLLQQIMSRDVLLTMMNSVSLIGESVNMDRKRNESCDKCFNLEAELLKSQNAHNDLLKNESCDNQNALEIPEFFKNNDLKAQLQDKYTAICMFKLDLEPLASRLLQNKEANIDYLKYTQEQADILRKIVKQAKPKQPLDKELDFACKHAQRIQELLVYVRDTCPNAINLSTKKVVVTPKTNIKKVRFAEPITSSINIKQVVQIVLWYLDSGCSKHMTWNLSQIMNSVSKFLGTVRFGNDHIARIMRYGDYQLGNVTISRVYYVEGLGHNLFSIGQFCDMDLEVAFRKNTCFIRNLEGVDLLSESRDTNLYTISLDDMLKTSLICLLSKASKTKSWLWHRRLSHLNFGTLNKLAKDGLARGIPRLKFQKDHLCSTCALGKSKKSSHQPKAEDTNQEKLYLLHMDLFLRTKDEAPEAIIKCIKNIQVRLNATVRNVRTDNGTEFVNQTLREFYENVGISHQTSVARTPQQNGVVERRNRTLVEAAHTMLIFSKAPLFLWAKAINTACYTQNRSLIRLRYNKTPYELMQDKKPDLSFFHVFGALCYPTNDNDDLGKLDAKADIGIFVGYAPAKKAFRIYNKRTRKIIETIHVTFDELTTMASEQFSSGPGLHSMTPATSSSGLVPNPIPQQPFPVSATPRAIDLADSPVSTSIDQDALSTSILSIQDQEHSLIICQSFEESPKTPHFHDDPLHESLHEYSTSQGSSSNVRPIHTPFESLGRWTKDHSIANVIRDPSRFVSTRKQLQTDAMWCYFDAFLTSVEPKNIKQAMTEPSWIDAMQEEIQEFERLSLGIGSVSR
ncbi:retrovirus-related pol polyprotein from transposon TNT 1-94 [Tanacetum coccineum]